MTRYYIARDKSGELWMYNYKPIKSEKSGMWLAKETHPPEGRYSTQFESRSAVDFDPIMKQIKWIDEEPTLFLMCR